jgi:L-fucose mutarotase
MLKTQIIHPELLGALARCGHKAKILIADSNYSFVTNSSPSAEIVYLNFAPGMIASTDILLGISQLIAIESATMMAWPDDFENTIYDEYNAMLPSGTPMVLVEREVFYSTVKSPDTLLVIATGETRRFANLLLTVGPVIY